MEFLEDSNRMYQSMGSIRNITSIISMHLGVLFTAAGVGDNISSIISKYYTRVEIYLAGVIAYCVGMALFTTIMGNAFAAFSVITVGIGATFCI